MTVKELNDDERRTVMRAIRQYGQGGHAYPDEQNVGGFAPDYAIECLRAVLHRAELSMAEREQIEVTIDKLL